MSTLSSLEKLVIACKISVEVVESSRIIGDDWKDMFLNSYKAISELYDSGINVSASDVKCYASQFLYFWNITIGPDTEKFWMELEASGVDYVRKDPLRFALEKNRFSRVDLGVAARLYWNELKIGKGITNRFTSAEIDKIGAIIKADEENRLALLQKCLKKNQIPQSQYLKFGDCMTYITNCMLWDKYFSKDEVQQLYDIWNNFKRK